MLLRLGNRPYSLKCMQPPVHYRVHKSLTQYHSLIQWHLFRTLQTNNFQISFNITFVTMSWFIRLGFQTMNFHPRHKSRSSRHPWFTHFNIIWRLYMTNFLLFNFIQASPYFLLDPNNFLQHPFRQKKKNPTLKGQTDNRRNQMVTHCFYAASQKLLAFRNSKVHSRVHRNPS